jgi:MFS family permease
VSSATATCTLLDALEAPNLPVSAAARVPTPARPTDLSAVCVPAPLRLLPAQMAVAAAREHVDKSSALGICSAIASSTQLLQPPVGALSDACGGRYRRHWLFGGQLICAVGCLGMLVGKTTFQISVVMSVIMLGSSVGWGVYLCIIPDYVPDAQHGVASGIQGFAAISGTITGSAIGYANGNGYLPLVWIYWCLLLKVLLFDCCRWHLMALQCGQATSTHFCRSN